MRILLLMLLLGVLVACERAPVDPLPSWNDGATKAAIIQFVAKVTDEKSDSFIAPEDRIATFDNDGTLWSEVPDAEVAFTEIRLRRILEKRPTLKKREPYKSLLAKSGSRTPHLSQKEVLDILALTHSGMSEDDFANEARGFFMFTQHPKYDVPYQNLTFKPMTELLSYLQSKDFKVYICSGGDLSFLRAIAPELYGVPPENIMGAFFVDTAGEKKGKMIFMRTEKIAGLNDREEKAINIYRHIGRRPIFAAGNIRNGGDIAHLRYSSEGTLPSLQILVNHDDPDREAAYGEKNNESLNAAKKYNWHVVSIKNDWKTVFPIVNGRGLGKMSKAK
ncbi:HAD family hydrolase [Bdellovibrio sp. HCB337]|uniref:HAD family hydrolase n=1 Tax=Bdellovibrio sp. HCB337 TaxID=3394358 RepID=UPI0039A4DACE